MSIATKNTALRNALATAFGQVFNGGTLTLYENTTEIAEFELEATAFGSPTNGKVSMNIPSPAEALATGTINKARLKATGDPAIVDLTVGEGQAGDFHIIIDHAEVELGQAINLLSFTWEEGEEVADPPNYTP